MKTYKVNVLNNIGDAMEFLSSHNPENEFSNLLEAEKLYRRELNEIKKRFALAGDNENYLFVEIVKLHGDDIEQIRCSDEYKY